MTSDAPPSEPPKDGAPRRRRKLSAIMMADVSGFSRMMGADEDGTVDQIKEFHRRVKDLVEQFEHNTRMQAMVEEVNALAERVQEAQRRLANATGAAADTARRLEAVAAKILTEPVRYGKPGLQEHIRYLSRMTTGVDQKIGRDAIERHAMLRRELDAVKAEVAGVLGSRE